jgi:hypothetical protein
MDTLIPDFYEHLESVKRRCERAEALECEITELTAHLDAGTYRLLSLIRELDECDVWGNWGLGSCAHWLNWKCGIGFNAAREKVRVAHALASLPLISEAFRKGAVSYSKVRAMTRVATPENEDYLLEIARHGTAAHVEKLVRAYRGVQREEERERANRQEEERGLIYYHEEDGSLVIKVRLPSEEGAVVMKAIEAAVEVMREDEAESGREKLSTGDVSAVTRRLDAEAIAERRADALVLMAETLLAGGVKPLKGGEKYQVVVHVSAEALSESAPGRCELESGPYLAADTARRIGCEASLVTIVEDDEGEPLDVGRKTRAIPPSIERALRTRDRGCRFPGCTRERFLDAHHIEHWAQGGETKLANLALLCRWHHRLVHEGGFGLQTSAEGKLLFTRPDGALLEDSPGPPRPGSVRALYERNRRAGLSIDAETGVSLWDGVSMDYFMAVDGLLQADTHRDQAPLSSG